MKQKIKQIIKTTLVIENKTSIDLCVNRINELIKNIYRENNIVAGKDAERFFDKMDEAFEKRGTVNFSKQNDNFKSIIKKSKL